MPVVESVMNAALEIIQRELPLRGYAQFHGFGSFRMQKLPAESGVTPQGEPYEVGERLTVQFNPGFLFREDIQKITGTPAIR
jgi:nucleoid DNA-binding protein